MSPKEWSRRESLAKWRTAPGNWTLLNWQCPLFNGRLKASSILSGPFETACFGCPGISLPAWNFASATVWGPEKCIALRVKVTTCLVGSWRVLKVGRFTSLLWFSTEKPAFVLQKNMFPIDIPWCDLPIWKRQFPIANGCHRSKCGAAHVRSWSAGNEALQLGGFQWISSFGFGHKVWVVSKL